MRPTCCAEECETPSLIIIRIETDEGPEFCPFCLDHLRLACDVVRAVGESVEAEL